MTTIGNGYANNACRYCSWQFWRAGSVEGRAEDRLLYDQQGIVPYTFDGTSDPSGRTSAGTINRYAVGHRVQVTDPAEYSIRGAWANGVQARASAAYLRHLHIESQPHSDIATRLHISLIGPSVELARSLVFRTNSSGYEVDVEDETFMVTLAVPLSVITVEPAELATLTREAVSDAVVSTSFLRSLGSLLVADEMRGWAPRSGVSLDRYLVDISNLVVEATLRPRRPGTLDPPRLRMRADAFISAHYTDPGTTPAVIAKRLGVSLRSLNRAYEGTLGAAHAVQRMRLEHAVGLLSDPAAPRLALSTIAATVGFGSLATFNRIFRAELGEPPQRFRRNQLQRAADQNDRFGVADS
jgi:AraC-like DNA-binding protein